MTGRTRELVAAELEEVLASIKVGRTAKYRVIANPGNRLDPILPRRAVLAVHRDNFTPAPNLGSRIENLSVWLVVPGLDLDKVEDFLDDCALEVEAAIDRSTHLMWTEGERAMYRDSMHAYRFAIQTITERKR